MTLAGWIRQSGVSQNELATRLGTSRQNVQHWLKGKSSPGLYFALALEAVTGGAIAAESWLDGREKLALKALRGGE